jgi:hypothetical protein
MSDDHLVNALEHGLQPDRPAVILDKGKGQGSPFAGEDRVTPASEANEEFPNVNTKDHCLDPRNPHCTLP